MICEICGCSVEKKLYKILFKCANCGFAWVDMDISDSFLSDIYAEKYFFGVEYVDYLKEKQALQKNFERNLQILIKFVPSGTLLEIGSAFGFFLDLAKKYYEVTGVDISAYACKYAKESLGLNIICDNFLKMELKENSYDAIVAWATLEHLNNPNLFIKKISRLLKTGGIFACSTVDIGALLPRIQKNRWRQIHPPTHLNFFSKKSLLHLLSKYGLTPFYCKNLGEYKTLYPLVNRLRSRLGAINKLFDISKLEKKSIYLNSLDTIYIFARK